MADKNEGMLAVAVLLAGIHVMDLMKKMYPEDFGQDPAVRMKMAALYGASMTLHAVMRAQVEGDPMEALRHIDSELSKISLVNELLGSGMSEEDIMDVLDGVGKDKA